MERGYWITLSNFGGQIDAEFAKNTRDFKKILTSWSASLTDGDVIRIKKGESEF